MGQVFCLVYHHLLFDGISVQLALSALDPQKRVTFGDWTPVASDENIEKKELAAFNLERFVPPSVVPQDAYLRLEFSFSQTNYEAFMLDWLTFVQQASGADEIVIGEVLSSRDSSPAAGSALGYFIQTWPLCISGKLTLEGLREAREEIKKRSTAWVKDHFTQNSFDHCWVVEPYVNSNIPSYFYSKPHYLLTLVLCQKGQDLLVKFCWNLEKIDARAAQEISQSFADFKKPTAEYDSMNELYAPQFSSIIERWKTVVNQYPEKIAVEDYTTKRLSFRELDQESNKLSSQLNIPKGECVGVYTTYSANIPIAFIAILKSGGIYVPLDPTVSAERRAFIIENSNIKTIISDLDLDFDGTVINPEEITSSGPF
ncbi:MAG: AMP-binding protein, partial [Bacteroidota bacterium]